MGFLEKIDRKRALLSVTTQSVSQWWQTIHEPFTGAWQMNATEESPGSLLKWPAIFHVITAIANDVAKMRMKLSIEDSDGIWNEIDRFSPFYPVLRKPNHFQHRLQFFRCWVVSLLINGNAYVLKERDERGIVIRMYLLDPLRVTVLQATDGAVFYELRRDELSGVIRENVSVPAEEMIHDRMTELGHLLVGVSPLYAAAMAGTMGRRIQDDSTQFYANHAMPGGVITGPARITDAQALTIKERWQTNFGGANRGKIAILGDNMKFEATRMTADASQLVEQYQLAIEDVARAFRYPIWKLTGKFPPYSSNPEQMTVSYYTDCLQPIIESIELCLDEGLDLPPSYGTEFDLDNLMRMDTASQIKTLSEGIHGSLIAPNEGRKKLNYKPAPGGNSPLAQQQNFSLEALAKRDASADPFAKGSTAAPSSTPPPENPPAERALPLVNEEEVRDLIDAFDIQLTVEDELRKELSPTP